MTETCVQLSEPAQSLLDHCLKNAGGEYDLKNWDGRPFPTWISSGEQDIIAQTLRENGYMIRSRPERRSCGCRPCCNWNRNSAEDLGDPCPGYRETHYFVVTATLARRMKLLADRQESPHGWSLEQAIAQAEELAQRNTETGGEALYKQCLGEMEHSVRGHLRQALVMVTEARVLNGSGITTQSPYYLPAEERVNLTRFAAEAAVAKLTADGTIQASTRRLTLHKDADGAWPAYTLERMEILITW
ncbi:MAG: hypothetical protein WC866_03540 [Patescibacteria group bacterium]|jgi:hypothetical protein